MTTAAQITYRARVDVQQLAIQALAETGNHSAAAKRAGVNRQTLYEWKAKYPDFAHAYEQALEISIDLLELEARNRATKGHKEPVFYKGAVVGEIYKPSDRLMELLLKAHRPDKYSDKQQIDLNASFTVEIAAFAAPGNAIPSGNTVIEHGSQAAKIDTAVDSVAASLPATEGGGVKRGAPPKLRGSAISEGIDIADFSNIFPESQEPSS